MKKQKISKTEKESIFKAVTQKVRDVDRKDIEKASAMITTVGAAVLTTAQIVNKIIEEIKKMRGKKEKG